MTLPSEQWKAPPEIATERLILVRPKPEDASEVFERYASDPDVTLFLGWPRHTSVSDTQAFLIFSASEWERWPAGPYLIRRRSDGWLLGGTGLGFESPEQAVTGYVLAKDAWGQGYATEALTAVVDVARQTGVRRLYALCHPEHQPSWRVLEKCGFVRESDRSEQAEFPNLAPGDYLHPLSSLPSHAWSHYAPVRLPNTLELRGSSSSMISISISAIQATSGSYWARSHRN